MNPHPVSTMVPDQKQDADMGIMSVSRSVSCHRMYGLM